MARKTKTGGQSSSPNKAVIIEETVEDAVEVTENGTKELEASLKDASPDESDEAKTAGADVEAESEAPKAADKTDEPTVDTPADDAPAGTDPEPVLDTDPNAPEPGGTTEPPEDTPPEDTTQPTEDAPAAYEPDPAPVPIPPPAQVTVQKVGFVPLVLGGVIAAALGFGAAWLYFGQQGTDLSAQLAAQSDQISALEGRIAELPTTQPDLAPLQAEIAAVQDSIETRIGTVSSDVSAQIAAFDERLTQVERAPGVDGTLAATAIASWETELDALRAEIAEQQTRMGDIATNAEAELEAARAEAARVEAEAAAAAEAAVVRAALARIQVALDSGTPFDAALADLAETGTEPPSVLADAAADGLPTIGELREAFPDAARAALAAARASGEADVDSNPVTAFLRNQFDVRSVAPREGDDPDAILSRVGAALNDNRLTDALAEIEGLPEVARAEMSDWLAQAQARSDAAAAIETLDQSMNN